MTNKSSITQAHEDFSIRLTKLCLILFAIISLLMLFVGPWIVNALMLRESPWLQGYTRYFLLLVSGYIAGAFALLFIVQLFQLVTRIGRGEVFIPVNVRTLQLIGWNGTGVAILSFIISLTCYLPFLILSVASIFMTLIIRVVRNAFSKAVLMQDELDYTI